MSKNKETYSQLLNKCSYLEGKIKALKKELKESKDIRFRLRCEKQNIEKELDELGIAGADKAFEVEALKKAISIYKNQVNSQKNTILKLQKFETERVLKLKKELE